MRSALSISVALFAMLFFCRCSSVSQKALIKQLKKTEDTFQDHVGFMLYDLDKNKSVVEYKAAKYFTPASNTKILTLYSSLCILGDSIPALHYVSRNDSLFIKGTGDPSLLNKNVLDNGRVVNFLNTDTANLYFYPLNFFTAHFGSGWSWEDYNYAFSAERSPLPIYGNVFEVQERRSTVPLVYPTALSGIIEVKDTLEESKILRAMESNKTSYYPSLKERLRDWTIPFRVDTSLVVKLLEDTLKRSVSIANSFPTGDVKILYSIPSDSLYKVMMQQSDNFIAEQLLLVCASMLGDSLKPEIPIEYITKNFLMDLPDNPVWVDGSGLSRYNLSTPRSIVKLWEKIYRLVPRERLFKILAIGGKPGTIRNYFKSETPYIFGKTGTLSNIHCLSGYLVTKKGKTLIFSFMNTNFTAPIRDVRKRMEEILKTVQERY